jgi:DNA polymerase III alpha subunit
MPALALTDLGNLFGLVKFYSARAARASSRLPGPMSGSPTRTAPEDA